MVFCVQMTTFTELVILREEERVLMKIASKLNDQLNRLKVNLLYCWPALTARSVMLVNVRLSVTHLSIVHRMFISQKLSKIEP